MLSRAWLLLAVLVGGCTTLQEEEPQSRLSYACRDVVVIGRISTMDHTPISEPGAFLQGWDAEWDLQINVKRVVRGSDRRRVIPARAIAHGQVREDVDFLIELSSFCGHISAQIPSLAEEWVTD